MKGNSRDWKKNSEKLTHRGGIFKHWQVESESPDGSMKGVFDVLEFSNWVNIVAITKDQKLIMVEQFRHGTSEMTLEIPGGAVDPGEEFLKAAQRELREETGYQSQHWKFLGQVSPNPAMMSNTCQTYLALNCEQTSSTDFDPLEDIEIKLLPLARAPRLVKEGVIHHSLVVAALYYWELYRAEKEDVSE